MRLVDHFIVGGSGEAPARKGDIFDPNNGGVQAQVALGTAETLERAVQAALKAQPAWAATNPQRRARVMFAFKELVEANMQSLAEMLSSEHGKTVPDARGDVQRGLEVIEVCMGAPALLKGEMTDAAAVAQMATGALQLVVHADAVARLGDRGLRRFVARCMALARDGDGAGEGGWGAQGADQRDEEQFTHDKPLVCVANKKQCRTEKKAGSKRPRRNEQVYTATPRMIETVQW